MMTLLAPRACALLTAALLGTTSALAQTTTIHQFPGGARLSTNLVQAADGTLFGVAENGGVSNPNGIVYRMQPDGSGYRVIYSPGIEDGGRPFQLAYAFLLSRDGILFGTSVGGGIQPVVGGPPVFGTVYRLNTDGSGFAVVRTFTAGGTNLVLDGGTPRGGLVQADDGFLYGCTTSGSGTSTTVADRAGVIYRIAPDGSGYRIIFSFASGAASATGLAPDSLTLGRDGNLYGIAERGPAAGGGTGGTVFRLRTDGTGFAVLKAFGRLATPVPVESLQSPLVHALDGYLYGTAQNGGAAGGFGGGAIYRLLPDGSAFEIIHTFAIAPGVVRDPAGAFFQGRDGSLYGRTNLGGTSNLGVIYKMRTDGTGFRVLASFSVRPPPYVGGLVQGLDGALYATADNTIIRVVETPGLEITQQPRSQTVAAGGSVTFTVTASGATTYQWRRNNANIAGATTAAYTLNALTTAANATYSVVVGNGNAADSVTSEGAVLLVAVPNPGRLINLSVRTSAGTGAQTLIAGFVVGGTGSKQVLVRAVGPTLGVFGVTGVLADPRLGLFSGSTETATNSGWGGGATLTNAFAQVGAFALGATSRDAALLSALPAGGYSAQVVSSSGGTGVALVEAYDADAASSASRFINLSARTVAGTGAQTLIAGFVLSGNVPRTLLIRGVGPGLNQFGVTGTLANPRLELHTTVNNRDTIVDANGGWGGAPALAAAFAQVGAFALPATSSDAAMLISLAPGSYTAQVAGAGGTTGVALVEVYELP